MLQVDLSPQDSDLPVHPLCASSLGSEIILEMMPERQEVEEDHAWLPWLCQAENIPQLGG